MRVLADGRVRRTRSEWQKIMRHFKKSGLTVAAFCEREDLSRSAFAEWMRKLGEKATPQPQFVEIPTNHPARPLAPPPQGDFELTLPGGVVLRWKA